jgi:hypothetical protein
MWVTLALNVLAYYNCSKRAWKKLNCFGSKTKR